MTGLLSAYDEQLRGEAELRGAADVRTIGPVVVGVFPGGTGFASYRDLAGLGERRIRSLVGEVRALRRIAGGRDRRVEDPRS